MRRNAAADWTIADIEKLCRSQGIKCLPPKGGGSHYKIAHPAVLDILTIPARRPIKPKYIRLLVKFVGLVIEQGAEGEP
ncbi:MAG: type II toxin-antitoxin system HicA family toxin [Bosea sp. (in: a-proteobacteria)]